MVVDEISWFRITIGSNASGNTWRFYHVAPAKLGKTNEQKNIVGCPVLYCCDCF